MECPNCHTNDNLAVHVQPIEAILGITAMDDSTVVAGASRVLMMNVGMETAQVHCNNCGHRWRPPGVSIDIQP
jgi:hypothetical protein